MQNEKWSKQQRGVKHGEDKHRKIPRETQIDELSILKDTACPVPSCLSRNNTATLPDWPEVKRATFPSHGHVT